MTESGYDIDLSQRGWFGVLPVWRIPTGLIFLTHLVSTDPCQPISPVCLKPLMSHNLYYVK